MMSPRPVAEWYESVRSIEVLAVDDRVTAEEKVKQDRDYALLSVKSMVRSQIRELKTVPIGKALSFELKLPKGVQCGEAQYEETISRNSRSKATYNVSLLPTEEGKVKVIAPRTA